MRHVCIWCISTHLQLWASRVPSPLLCTVYNQSVLQSTWCSHFHYVGVIGFSPAGGPLPEVCGQEGNVPCPDEPVCGDRLVPSEQGVCITCGNAVGAPPCNDPPYCEGRLVGMISGMMLDFCVACGGVNQPPCSDKLDERPCNDGLWRTSVSLINGRRIDAQEAESLCTKKRYKNQCGFVGQESCDGVCYGRSVTSDDGTYCEECGGDGERTCDGPNQAPCDPGSVDEQQDDLVPICVSDGTDMSGNGIGDMAIAPGDAPSAAVPPAMAPEATDNVELDGIDMPTAAALEIIESDPYGLGPPADSPSAGAPPNTENCGKLGQVPCSEVPHCEPRLIVDENAMCASLSASALAFYISMPPMQV